MVSRLKNLGLSFERSKIEKACGILSCLRDMGYELTSTPIPMPRNPLSLKLVEGKDLEVSPDRRGDIDPLAMAVLSEFCKTQKRPFKVIKVHEFDGFRVMECETFDVDEIAILETNLDDVSGEILGNALERLSKLSPDVTFFQGIGKKGRPMVMIRVLCSPDKVYEVAKSIMEETGTLGVRIIFASRLLEGRRIEERRINVFGRDFVIRVKYSSSSLLKPEFEDVKRISEDLGLPLPVVYKEVLRKL